MESSRQLVEALVSPDYLGVTASRPVHPAASLPPSQQHAAGRFPPPAAGRPAEPASHEPSAFPCVCERDTLGGREGWGQPATPQSPAWLSCEDGCVQQYPHLTAGATKGKAGAVTQPSPLEAGHPPPAPCAFAPALVQKGLGRPTCALPPLGAFPECPAQPRGLIGTR